MDPGFALVLGTCLDIWFVYMHLLFLDLIYLLISYYCVVCT